MQNDAKSPLDHPLRIPILAAISLMLLSTVHFFSPDRGGLWLQTFLNSMHVPVFGLLSLAVLLMTPAHWSRGRRIGTVGVVVVVAGVVSELAQIGTERSASVADFGADVIGASAFLLAGVGFMRSFHVPSGAARYLLIAAAILVCIPLWPLAKVTTAYWDRFEQLPVLLDPQAPSTTYFVQTQNVDTKFVRLSGDSRSFIEFGVRTGGRPMIQFEDLWGDWSQHRELVIEMRNPVEEPLPYRIRINDARHLNGSQPQSDRFSKKMMLETGDQIVRIPLSEIRDAPSARQMDLGQIDRVVVFFDNGLSGRNFWLFEIRLE